VCHETAWGINGIPYMWDACVETPYRMRIGVGIQERGCHVWI
jgi:hypothetical protein